MDKPDNWGGKNHQEKNFPSKTTYCPNGTAHSQEGSLENFASAVLYRHR